MSMLSAEKRQRHSHIFVREENNHYVEPQRCSERLFEMIDGGRPMSVWDPACGFGRIVRAASARGHLTLGTDIIPRWINNPDGPHGRGLFEIRDFFADTPSVVLADAIVSNPPFDRAQEFADLALQRAGRMVALLLPTKWLNGSKRALWRQTTPLHLVMPISPRPSMPPGHVIAAGGKATGGTVDFAWFVWLQGYRGRPMIEDCRLSEEVQA